MHQPLTGITVVEVAQFVFVPSAGAALADWGADVIKVEHAERGGACRTADGEHVQLVMTTPGPYAADLFARPELASDPRFATAELLVEHTDEAAGLIAAAIASAPLAAWTERFAPMRGQWALVQDRLQLGHDPQLRANGYIAPVTSADGPTYELVAGAVT